MITRKKPLDFDFPKTIPVRKTGWTITTRTYKVITPLWGGGVEANVNDPVTLIRGSSIRGHLRFWWRALRGNSNGSTITAMREKENSIWGSTKVPSQVQISVNVTNKGTKFQATNFRGEQIEDVGAMNSKDSYVTFPLRLTPADRQAHRDPASLTKNVQFSVVLEYPDSVKDEVEAALWAWQTFGGIGARTRRGMGAIECIQVDKDPLVLQSANDFQKSISENLEKWIVPGAFPKGVPHISHRLKYKLTSIQNDNTGIEALRNIINQYKRFRQSRPGRGRSHWPEPDLIRACFPGKTFRHPIAHRVHGKAPRAVFGLPIIIQFKRYNDGGRKDPEETTIQGVGGIDRLASPLLIRPIHLSSGFTGMAVLLEWDTVNTEDEPYTPPDGLAVVYKRKTVLCKPSTRLTPADASHIEPLNRLSRETNPLLGFLRYIK
ncbi:MAG: type III-B CRISPR module RAMP protein Cmr1 [Anaerolineaceae bacterium]|jgi:CRISPR-associated protein Cmr1